MNAPSKGAHISVLRNLTRTAAVVITALAVHGCYTYPAVVSVPPSFDASWQAARLAAQDVGVQVTTEDRSSGTIRGTTGSFDVLISVTQQADGAVAVAFTAKGPQGQDPTLQERLASAYHRRMGR